jgi:disulfide bond formation protein DsbB
LINTNFILIIAIVITLGLVLIAIGYSATKEEIRVVKTYLLKIGVIIVGGSEKKFTERKRSHLALLIIGVMIIFLTVIAFVFQMVFHYF